ncbi:MAG: hypothetical protein K8T26_09195 [Lentisphaerae bacterium]|nr:hypothetical protein [Lentisphaerota bacterium]
MKRLILFFLQPIARARGMRDNDSAQVLLMTAFMAFTLAVFMIHSLNASQSVFRRVQVQNAADAAADASAAWQARGINMLQTLNNMHYVMDAVLYLPIIRICCCCSEAIAMCAACVASLGFCGACCDECTTCIDLCSKCSDYDDRQAEMHKDFWNAEVKAIKVSTQQIYIQANQYAKANGATPFFRSAVTYVSNTAYQAISPIFPMHEFLKDSIKAGGKGGPPLQFEKHRGSANIAMKIVKGPLHAVLIWGGPSYDRIWVNMLGTENPIEGDDRAGAALLGYEPVEPGTLEFPWDLPEWFMQFCSLGQSDGWNDDYWEMRSTPTLTWATCISNQVGGLVRFLPKTPPTDKPASMFWYLNPGRIPEVSLSPVMGLASATSHGKIEATSLLSFQLGKAGAQGTLVPVDLQGPWFPQEALKIGIFH